MKLWILSDLHFEANGDHLWEVDASRIPNDADVCVLAGDIAGSHVESLKWANSEIAWRMPVVYVAGNHEFYGGRYGRRLDAGRAYAEDLPDVHFLENNNVVLGGVRFLGATLWTDFMLEGARDAAGCFTTRPRISCSIIV